MILLDSECEYEGRGINRMVDTYQFDPSYTFEDIDSRMKSMYNENLGRDPYDFKTVGGYTIVKVIRYERVPDYLERRANKFFGPS